MCDALDVLADSKGALRSENLLNIMEAKPNASDGQSD
jgi:hypothetical protein